MATDQSTVTYRDIPGFPGYRVGDDGSVWTCLERHTVPGVTGAFQRIGQTWKRKTLRLAGSTGHGHLSVTLRDRRRYVHRLVLLAFVGPCPEGMECRHEDDDHANNTLANLSWGTRQQNIADRERNGGGCRGEKSAHAKLTAAQVRSIRADYAAGNITFKGLGKKHGISMQHAHAIVRRKLWGHLA